MKTRGSPRGSPSAALLLVAVPLAAFEIPDEGNAPLRRMVGAREYLPETRRGGQDCPGCHRDFQLSAHAPLKVSGAVTGRWRRARRARDGRFYVSADGKACWLGGTVDRRSR